MAREILTPGAVNDADEPAAVTITKRRPAADDPAAKIAELQAEVAMLKAKQGLDPAAAAVVYTPVTPKGKEHIAASAYASMTSVEVMAKIDAGEAREPSNAVLCSDGWYTPRVWRA